MPEGDSVHRLARRLDTATAGQTIVSSELRWPSVAGTDLSGVDIEGWLAHGKHLLTTFSDGRSLHTHLGMDGSWAVLRPGRRLPRDVLPRLRVALDLADGRSAVGVDLKVVDIVTTRDLRLVLGHLGPDVLAADFDPVDGARRIAASPDRRIGEALLDQRGVAGLGNLWVVETLFLRGVHPDTPAGKVDLTALLRLAQRMIRHSLEHGSGQTTTGNRRRGMNHWVYGRAGRPCRRCGTPIAFRPGNRSSIDRETWWCPHCQPAASAEVRCPGPSGPAADRSPARPRPS